MKMILLLSAAYLNGGAYADAGTQVAVGDGKNEITEERAEEIVVANRAEELDVGEDDAHDEVDELDKLKVAELKDLAAEEEVDLGSATTKPAIIAAIRAHRAG